MILTAPIWAPRRPSARVIPTAPRLIPRLNVTRSRARWISNSSERHTYRKSLPVVRVRSAPDWEKAAIADPRFSACEAHHQDQT